MDLIAAVRDDHLWEVPLDQGSFDEKQSKLSIAVTLLAVGQHFEKENIPQDSMDVWATMWDSLFVHGASVEWGDNKDEWRNGLPSGWRWTAVLDTILNVCSFRAIIKIIQQRLGRHFFIGNFYAQGDDVVFTATDLDAIRLIIDTYKKLGYEVHRLKTYISRGRAEFLRQSYEQQFGVTDYTARTVHGLRFKNPIQTDPITKGERIYSVLRPWHLAMLRGGTADNIANMFLEDIGAQQLPAKKAASFCLTPNCLGGARINPSSAFGATLTRRSDGQWYTLEVSKELRALRIPLGGWKERLEKMDWDLGEKLKEDFFKDLAMNIL